MPRNSNVVVPAALAALLVLGGCSELYIANSDKIGPTAGDALAIDRVTQVVDPWPIASANRDIAFNGQRMQAAVERYRNGKVYPPKGMGTSGTYQQQSSDGSAQNTTPVGPTITQPAAPTK